ncbi:MAG TPA: aldolase catalytic domain-containing protein [Desulfomonilia bacterium]|nr:aldolase catalytic domain-containing protein [Desulfomonilia bacterium]
MTKETEPRKVEKKGSWLTYRPDIKVFDCTIRDGGLVNNSRFEDDFIKAVYQACVDAGIDYMEMGYKGSKKIYSPQEFGMWKFCDEDDIRRIIGDNPTDLKISAMADAERTDYHTDILPKDQSPLDMIRVATYIHQIPTAVDMIKAIHDKGYETTLNLMAISVVPEHELDEALEMLVQTEVNVIYLVDSYGALYSEDVQALTRKYLGYAYAGGKQVGIHTHNNQQLAYANTIEALILGASYLDATMAGFGRGAGNCPIELLLGFLKNPKFHVRPILKCIQEKIMPLREKISWGFDIPYMITGQLNIHPRSAISFLNGHNCKDYVSFYDAAIEEE